MLIVAVAAGVTSTFGATYGGIMFAIECCTAIFLVGNLWRSFICATMVKCVYTLFVNPSGFLNTFLVLTAPGFSDCIMHGIFMGIICGWLGTFWIFLFANLKIWLSSRKGTKWEPLTNRYIWVTLVSIWIAATSYPLNNTAVGPKVILGQLFYLFRLSDVPKVWSDDYMIVNLIATFITRYFNCLLFATCPIPCGIFLPS